jgi:hypothetical protein
VCVFARIIIEGGAYFGLTNEDITAFRRHMRQELQHQQLYPYSFPQNVGINIFFSSSSSSESSTLKCNHCQFVAKSAKGLKIHATKMHASTSDALINVVKQSKPFQCHKCDSILSSQPSLQKHIQTFHSISQTKEIMCHLCSVLCSTEAALKKHINTFHLSAQQEIKCELCSVLCSTEAALKKHIKTLHSTWIVYIIAVLMLILSVTHFFFQEESLVGLFTCTLKNRKNDKTFHARNFTSIALHIDLLF